MVALPRLRPSTIEVDDHQPLVLRLNFIVIRPDRYLTMRVSGRPDQFSIHELSNSKLGQFAAETGQV